MIMLRDAAETEQLENIRRLYESSFPKAEKKPFEFMRKKQREGFFHMLAIEDEAGHFCGLAIMMLFGGWALLDYLAIEPRCQGTGLGSRTLEELQKRYGKERLVVEIESTAEAGESSAASDAGQKGDSAGDGERAAHVREAGSVKEADAREASGETDGTREAIAPSEDGVADRRKRLRRKAFYLRNGMVPMDFRVDLFGVEMEVLTFGSQITFEQYHGIYEGVLPEAIAQKVRKVQKFG